MMGRGEKNNRELLPHEALTFTYILFVTCHGCEVTILLKEYGSHPISKMAHTSAF